MVDVVVPEPLGDAIQAVGSRPDVDLGLRAWFFKDRQVDSPFLDRVGRQALEEGDRRRCSSFENVKDTGRKDQRNGRGDFRQDDLACNDLGKYGMLPVGRRGDEAVPGHQ